MKRARKTAFIADPPEIFAPQPVFTVLTELPFEHAPEVEKQPAGIVCRECGCADLRVYRTVKLPKNRIRRERICRHCSRRMITTEQESLR